MINIPDKKLSNEFINLIKKYYIGNFILFEKNLGDINEISELTNEIQKICIENNGLPALISIDQEGGNVSRFKNSGISIPGQMLLSATNKSKNCEKVSEINSYILKCLGINMNLSPVCDLNTNFKNPAIGSRSFGSNPIKSSEFIKSFIKGHKKNNVFTCGKHFPGHGDTSIDSHLDLPFINKNDEELNNLEFIPFKAAIESNVESIMMGHILTLNDLKNPSSFSKHYINYLREKLNFKGLILTDSIWMGAIKNNFGYNYSIIESIKNGINIIITGTGYRNLNDLSEFEIIDEIINLVKNNNISINCINNSFNKILEYKNFINIKNSNINNLNLKFYQEKLDLISLKGITLVQDKLNLLPLKSNNCLIISTNNWSEDSFKADINKSIAEIISNELNFEKLIINNDPNLNDFLNFNFNKFDIIIFATHRMNWHQNQFTLINFINSKNQNLIILSFFDPYEVLNLEFVSTLITTYELSTQSIKNIIKLLKNSLKFKFLLPF